MLKTLQRFGYLKNNSYLCSVEKKILTTKRKE